jgi:hypothetical protein
MAQKIEKLTSQRFLLYSFCEVYKHKVACFLKFPSSIFSLFIWNFSFYCPNPALFFVVIPKISFQPWVLSSKDALVFQPYELEGLDCFKNSVLIVCCMPTPIHYWKGQNPYGLNCCYHIRHCAFQWRSWLSGGFPVPRSTR